MGEEPPGSASPEQEIARLRRRIDEHNERYYDKDAPVISDREYDRMYDRLVELEARFPKLRTDDSPTQRIGGRAAPTFAPVRHAVPMLSLDKARTQGEVSRFFARVSPPGWQRVPVMATPKMDGLAVSLVYEDRSLKVGATRGDGQTGEDVTANIVEVKDVPRMLPKWAPANVMVRGEVLMSKASFAATNEQQKKTDGKLFVSTRNAAAGTLRQLDPRLTRHRQLDFRAYWLRPPTGRTAATAQENFELLRELGFVLAEPAEIVHDTDEFYGYLERLLEQRGRMEHEIDGVVLRLDDIERGDEMGASAKSPRAMLAYKLEDVEVDTRVVDVEFSVGRTGVVTPVAKLEPVVVGGVTVSSATLHNWEMVETQELHYGDAITLIRSGDVIPKVVEVHAQRRAKDAKPVQAPDSCPDCGAKLERHSVNLVCTSPSCQGVLLGRLSHFVSRNAMDIEGFGDKRLALLIESGQVTRPADLFALKAADFEDLERLAEKSAANLEKALDHARATSLARLLFALGIPGLGAENARVLEVSFGSMAAIRRADPATLCFFKPMQLVIAQAVADFFASAEGRQIVLFAERGVRWQVGRMPRQPVPAVRLLEHVRYLADAQEPGADAAAGDWPRLSLALVQRLVASDETPTGLDELLGIDEQRLEQIGASSRLAASGAQALSQLQDHPGVQRLVEQLRLLAGVEWGQPAREQPSEGPLAGMAVVVTGTLPGYDRKAAHKLVEDHGGKVSAAVAKSTDLVVVGDKPGKSKTDKAVKFGIRTVDADGFLAMLDR